MERASSLAKVANPLSVVVHARSGIPDSYVWLTYWIFWENFGCDKATQSMVFTMAA